MPMLPDGARAYNMSVVWVWAGPDKGCTVPPFRRRYFPIEEADDADAPSLCPQQSFTTPVNFPLQEFVNRK